MLRMTTHMRTNLYIPTTSFSSNNLVKTAPVTGWDIMHLVSWCTTGKMVKQNTQTHNHMFQAFTWPSESQSDPGYVRCAGQTCLVHRGLPPQDVETSWCHAATPQRAKPFSMDPPWIHDFGWVKNLFVLLYLLILFAFYV